MYKAIILHSLSTMDNVPSVIAQLRLVVPKKETHVDACLSFNVSLIALVCVVWPPELVAAEKPILAFLCCNYTLEQLFNDILPTRLNLWLPGRVPWCSLSGFSYLVTDVHWCYGQQLP